MRAPYASDPAQSRGRFHAEPEHPLRTAFARDRDRLIHAAAFRRLRRKTQVFVAPDGDHFRVRLTHSLEVAQIARTLARVLGLDEDLTEVLALGHDIGHPPFGHAGEHALDAAMEAVGGFDHNGHGIRIVTKLEIRTPAYDGLNLSWETLEGLAKHNGPVAAPGWALAECNAEFDLDLGREGPLEAQIAAAADDIAYNAHDLDDGLRAGILSLDAARAAVPLIDDLWRGVLARWPAERRVERLRPQLVRDLIGTMVSDVLATTRRNLAEMAPRSADAVRGAGRPLAGFSDGMRARLAPLRAYLMRAFYLDRAVTRFKEPATRMVAALYRALRDDPARLPAEWRAVAGDPARGRVVGDYVAGMTDRFAIMEYMAIFGEDAVAREMLAPETAAPAAGHGARA